HLAGSTADLSLQGHREVVRGGGGERLWRGAVQAQHSQPRAISVYPNFTRAPYRNLTSGCALINRKRALRKGHDPAPVRDAYSLVAIGEKPAYEQAARNNPDL